MAERTVSVGIRMQMAGAITAVKSYRQAWVEARGELQKNVLAHRDAISTLSQTATVAGAVLVAGVGYAVKKFADFDAQMSNVNSVLHETDQNMALLRDAAMDAGRSTVYSATEAAEAIEELGKAGISTEDILSGGLNGALSVAAAGNLDVAKAAEIAALAMQQFGLSGDQIPHVADLLAAAAGKSLGSVEDLGMALQQSGLVANQFGLSMEDTTGALAAFASAGLIGSDAGTSLKTMLLMLANPSKESAGLMEELGINAYDAAGNFVGLTNLAGQLQTKMAGLTQAQRDQALAQIFGSDALRAANVLYTEGSQGIQDWTSAVDDAGYASEVAAARLDNLQGDLQGLQSALETALIETGSGANTVLRSLVQSVTDAVNAFGTLPGPVQTTLLAIGGIGGASLLAVGGLGSMIVKAAEVREAFQNLQGSSGRITGSLLRMGSMLTGPWGLAIGAGITVLGAFAAEQARSKADVDELSQTLDAQTGAVTGNTRAWVAKKLQDEGAFETAKRLGVSQSELVDAVLYGTDALAGYRAEMASWQAAADATDDGMLVLTEDQKEQFDAAADLDNQISQLQGTYSDAAVESENMRAAVSEGTAAADNASAATQVYAESLGVSATAAEDAKAGIDELDQALKAITDTLFGVQEAEDAVAAIVNQATEQFAENGGALTGNTEAALDNRDTIRNLISAYLDQVAAVAESTGSQEQAMATAEDLEAQFRDLARRLGLTEDQIDDYAAAFDNIPRVVNTTVTTTYKTRGRMPSIKGGDIAVADGGYIPGFANGGYARGFPVGGFVTGAGGPRTDEVRARLSPGEFVINARATARHRSLLEAINSGRTRTAARPVAYSGFGQPSASGGTVRIQFDFTNISDDFARAIRKTVRVDGGGNVQLAFGSR
jgi:TP901 family phage tail tape measure protein